MILTSAPAKIILFGEHFVVEDRLALAAAINLRAKIKADFNDSKYFSITSDFFPTTLNINVDDITYHRFSPIGDFFKPLLFILHDFSKNFELNRGIDFIIESEIPVGMGLGSSAAVSVAFTAALFKLMNYPFTLKDIISFASKGEYIAHGRPSGIDPTISTIGGIILYSRSCGFNTLDIKLNEPILIGITGEVRSTVEMVDKVLKLKNKYPYIFKLIYEANDMIVREAINAMKIKDYIRLGELMNIAHGLLSSLGVSNLNLERLIYAVRKAGAYGAKLTGAGGGGAMIALCNSDSIDHVVKAIGESGGRVLYSNISYEGVKIHEKYS
ncbi:MAG: mevalonate kinase [Candidatus Methanomethylicia archaeon]|nr:mevalonate kinase [Candidatus Methanomethylicia archaeon]MCX8169075.1 mevalonate kinase [Candidatus Methanomethylicia archaeon]MDW7988807.1 mevalonate kinase [Nitrososphaerota archaeon]